MEKVRRITTAEELFDAGEIGPCELVRGRLVMMNPAGGRHGRVGFRLARLLGNHVEAEGLGTVFAAETGFIVSRNPDTVLAPDIAFVRADRRDVATVTSFVPGAPDLAVEVVSPRDSAPSMAAKAHEWLAAGTRLVWVLDPEAKTVTAHSPHVQARVLGVFDHLDGEDVVPGFRIAVGDIFA